MNKEEKQVLGLAKEKLNSLGYNLRELKYEMKKNVDIKNCCLNVKNIKGDQLPNFLANKNYYEVLFLNKGRAHKGGDACVYVDSDNFTIMGVFLGK